MSKNRYINTKFWSDSWVRQKLNPLDRYLFIYFLTNEHTNISGIYELPIEAIAFETGLDERDLNKSLLPRLRPKIYYKDNWVIIPNFLKHQNCQSPTVQKGITAEISRIPQKIIDYAIGYGYGIDTISHLNLNLNLNPNPNPNTSAKAEKELTIEYVNSNTRKDIRIIFLYARAKGKKKWSAAEEQSFIKRNLRYAKLLEAYSYERIMEVMKYLNENADFKWTLETIGKYIDEDLTKLKGRATCSIK